jgi:signal transduction histidine kinase
VPSQLRRIAWSDAVPAAVLTLAMAAAGLLASAGSALTRAGACVAGAGLLALTVRRSRPLPAAFAVMVVVLAEVVAAPQATAGPAFLALMLASYSLAVHARPLALAVGLAGATATIAAAQLLSPPQGYSHAVAITFFTAVLVAAPAAVGAVVRARTALLRRLHAGTETLRGRAPAELAARRAEQQRVLAADIGHVILTVLERMSRYAEVRDLAEVTALRDLGREALGRMRELVGALRASGAGEPAQLWPERPVHDVTELRAQVERVLAAAHPEPVPRRATWTLRAERWRDPVLAVLACCYAVLMVLDAARPGQQVLIGAVALLCVAPALRVRRWPVAATGVAVLAAAALTWLDRAPDGLGGLPAGLLLIGYPLLVGAAAPAYRAVFGLALCLAGAGAAIAVAAGPVPGWSELVSSAALAVGSWAAGRVLRAGARAVRDSAQAAVEEQAARYLAARDVLAADRSRVARDLHDAVGHAMTAIVIQATAAARIWDQRPELAAEHVAALRRTLAEVLADLRPLVSSVTLDSDAATGLAGLPELAARAARTGLVVQLDVAQPDSALDARVDAVGYRVAQEALTNAARYAPGSTVRIRLAYPPEGVDLEISNGPAAHPPADPAGSGHGLRGMAERVSGCGGFFTAEPDGEGGFRVLVRLPRVVPVIGVAG